MLKRTTWAATVSFGFTGDLGAFTLTTTAARRQQHLQPTWRRDLRGDEKARPAGTSPAQPAPTAALRRAIDLAAGEDVTCTFENTQRGA